MTTAIAVHAKPTAAPSLPAFAVEHLLLLPLGAALALVWANLGPESYFTFSYAAAFFVNDIAMALFFALIAKEVVEATVAGGVLHPLRRALAPMVASFGVVLVPAAVLVLAARLTDSYVVERVWTVPGAVDLAIGYFVLRVIFRPRHPVIPFFLLLGIAADALVLVLLPLLYSNGAVNAAVFVALMALALVLAMGLRRARVRSFWPYLLLGGGTSWCAFYWGGLQPALALVPIVPFLPHAPRDPGFFVDAPPDSHDALNRFELWGRYPAQGALFFFGLVNAGVQFGALEDGTWVMPIAALVGKPAGLLLGAGLVLAAGLHLPRRVAWRELLVAGLASASGFSVGLFVANLALAPGQFLSETRMGVLLTLAAVPLALAAARLLRVGRFAT